MDYILKAKLACLSTDEKPTSIPGYTNDLKYSVLWELDTDKKYYYTGEEWVEVGKPAGGNNIYLLNETELTGHWVATGGGAYIFLTVGNSFNADAKTALETLTGGGTYPTITITCPELNVEGLTLEWSTDNEEWETEEASLSEDEGYTLAIKSASAGATITATITLSFPEPEEQ